MSPLKTRGLPTCEMDRESAKSTKYITTRTCLLVWAYLRLVVSILWTSLILFALLMAIKSYLQQGEFRVPHSYVVFEALALIPQSVEIGMLIIFIVAGHMKSVKLYHVYYRYCFVTLLIYVGAIFMSMIHDYKAGHFYVEIYITYHFDEILYPVYKNYNVIFGVAALIDICLEVVLLYILKKQMKKYTYPDEEKLKTGQDV